MEAFDDGSGSHRAKDGETSSGDEQGEGSNMDQANCEDIQDWLARWLEERYIYAEKWLEESFIEAIGKDEGVVREVLRVCGWDGLGFECEREEEWRARVKWLRGGDVSFFFSSLVFLSFPFFSSQTLSRDSLVLNNTLITRAFVKV